ncbi:MAG: protein kinase, partial [Thermoguttaceae bacterium]
MNKYRTTCNPQRIQLFLDQKLSDAELSAFESHLSNCDDCRRRLETTVASEDIWSEMQESLRDEQLPPDGLQSGDSDSTGEDASSSQTTVLNLLAPTDDDRMLGRWGMYEVVGVVGTGGMGVVLKALDAALNRYVAIKVLAPHLGTSGAARKRFSREAQASAAVVHDNVIEIYGVAEAAGLPYLVMPYVRGPSLQRRIDGQGPLALVEILRVGMQAAAGLAAAHAQGLVHRDVKPANILLADGVERVKLTDFGLARAADDASLTKTGIIAGTPQYMSPEQARGEAVDQRSDLFSLGSVLYAMCTGRPPFRAETSYGVLRRITDEEPRPIREINPEIPEWLCQVVAKLMTKRRDDRFQSAGEVAVLLEQCLAHVQQPTVVPLPAGVPPLGGKGPRIIPPKGETPARGRPRKPLRTTFWKGTLAMLTLIGISLFAVGVVSTNPPDISGNWQGEGCGQVTLTQTAPGEYSGTYTDTVAKEKESGRIELKWSRIERRFNGTWCEGEDRFGELSIRLADQEIRGALTTDARSKLNPATPRLADLLWSRTGERTANDEIPLAQPDPIVLLRAVEKARLGVPPGRLVIGSHFKEGEVDNNCRLEVVFDGDKRQFRYESPNSAKIRTMFDGTSFLHFDGTDSATISDPARWQWADYLFDPRTLGLTGSYLANETLTLCLGYQKAKSVTLVGPERVRGKSTWHVRVVDSYEQQLDFWIEPVAGFPVHRLEFSTSEGFNQIRGEVYCGDNPRFPWLPSRVETKDYCQGKPMGTREVTISKADFDVPIPPETWTLAGLDLPIGTPVTDLRVGRLGYWDGRDLSQAPPLLAGRKKEDAQGAAASPPENVPGTVPPRNLGLQRIATLEALVRAVETDYSSGLAKLSDLYDAQDKLLNAQLEAAKSKAERVAIWERALKSRQDIEMRVEALFKAGAKGGSQADFLRAQAECQKAELRLAEEKGRSDGGGPSEYENAPETAPPPNLVAQWIATLEGLVSALEAKYRSGLAALSDLLDAQNKLLEAELESAKSKPERVAIWEKVLKMRQETENMAEARAKAMSTDRGAQADFQRARAERQKTEAGLAKEKARGDAPKERATEKPSGRTAASLVFGPVIERTLLTDGPHDVAIDLDTGKTRDMQNPQDWKPGLANWRKWATSNGVDLAAANEEQLWGFDMAILPDRRWDPPPQTLQEQMDQTNGGFPVVIT